MGQIFACILPGVFQTKVKEFSNIEDERPLKLARHIKRKPSRKDARYKAKVSLPGTVNSPVEPEPEPLEPNVITLTEKVKAKVAELKIGKSNEDCRQFRKRRFRGKKRGKKMKKKTVSRNDQEPDGSVVQEAWGTQPGKVLPRPRPRDFYKKTFGAKVQDTREPSAQSPSSEEHTKEKSEWKFWRQFPSLPSFFRKGSNDESEKRSGDGDIDENTGPPQRNRKERKPRDFYKKTFGANEQDTREPSAQSPSSKEHSKEKSGWKFWRQFPSLPSFFKKGSNGGIETRNGDGDIDENAGPPHKNGKVVQEAWGLEPGSAVPLPRPGDIYHKTFGANAASTAQKDESPTTTVASKNEKRWYITFRTPSLPAFLKKSKNSGRESRTGDEGDGVGDKATADKKRHGDVDPSKNIEEELVISDYVTTEGCSVKVICVQPLASSSTNSIAAASDQRPLELEVATSASITSQEVTEQEDKTFTLPPLPRPSPWKEMYNRLIRSIELPVVQTRNDSTSTKPGNLKTKKSVQVKGFRKLRLKSKRRKKKHQEQKALTVDNGIASEPQIRKTKKSGLGKRIRKPKLKTRLGKKKKEKEQRSNLSLTHENGTVTASASSSGTSNCTPPPNPVRLIHVAEADETAATPLAIMATTD